MSVPLDETELIAIRVLELCPYPPRLLGGILTELYTSALNTLVEIPIAPLRSMILSRSLLSSRQVGHKARGAEGPRVGYPSWRRTPTR
jgi:hypothetical protein